MLILKDPEAKQLVMLNFLEDFSAPAQNRKLRSYDPAFLYGAGSLRKKLLKDAEEAQELNQKAIDEYTAEKKAYDKAVEDGKTNVKEPKPKELPCPKGYTDKAIEVSLDEATVMKQNFDAVKLWPVDLAEGFGLVATLLADNKKDNK